jgi:hypothetical protein
MRAQNSACARRPAVNWEKGPRRIATRVLDLLWEAATRADDLFPSYRCCTSGSGPRGAIWSCICRPASFGACDGRGRGALDLSPGSARTGVLAPGRGQPRGCGRCSRMGRGSPHPCRALCRQLTEVHCALAARAMPALSAYGSSPSVSPCSTTSQPLAPPSFLASPSAGSGADTAS